MTRKFRTSKGNLVRQGADTIPLLLVLGLVLLTSGCAGVLQGNSSGGGTPPTLTISNVAATNATVTGASVAWQTNVSANSQVEYGTSTSYGSTTALDATMVTSHQETLTGLKPANLYHYRVHSTDANNGTAASGDLTFATAADTTPPTVSITSPLANATLSGTVSLMASATDDVAVASVQFKADNANMGTATTTAPYTYALNTTTLSDGNHILTAVATDTSGNTATSTGVAVKVNNTIPAPSITSLNPASGVVGTSVTINGANFGATRGTSTVTFNGIAATPASWSATSIVAAVPNGARTGSVVVTVGGVASNGVSFTVQTDTTPPVVTITSPTNNATISGTITVAATAADADSVVSFVQFQVDGANMGAQLTAAPYSISLDTTALTNATHSLTAVAQDPSGNMGTSTAVTITVSNTTSSSMGPLVASSTNNHWFVDPAGKGVAIVGSQTWNTFQDHGNKGTIVPIDYTAFLNFLIGHGHNATIFRYRSFPQYCNWGAGGTWIDGPSPWARSGTPGASDGGNKFDLNTFNQAYFDRIRARAMQAQQAGIYIIVEMFDGIDLKNNRCGTTSPTGDGYPFTGVNNINGVNDGYISGTSGTTSMTMTTNNAITNVQDAYVKKLIDTLNDLPNIIWEHSKEAPPGSATFWQPHMIGLIHTYEAGGTWEGTTYPGKPLRHPVLYVTIDPSFPNDSLLYNSNTDAVAPATRIPSVNSNCGTGIPACKVVINDSDHSYFGMWNDTALQNRQFAWENFANGDSVLFQDPYLVYWSSGSRNLCDNDVAPAHGVCTLVDQRWENLRHNLGAIVAYGNTKLDLVKMTPQPSLSSTGFCLSQNVAVGGEFLVYFPTGGVHTVNLSAQSGRTLNVEWFDPVNLTYTPGGVVSGGSPAQSFSPPWGSSYDGVLYLVDAAGHN